VRIFERVGDAFNSSVGAEEKLEQVARAIVEQLDLRACHFRVLSRDQRTLDHFASYGLSDRFLAKGSVDAEKSVGEALQGVTVMVEDCRDDPRIQYPEEHAEEGIVSLLTVPLRTRGQVIGVMRLSTKERRVFSEQEMTMIETLASFSTSAIAHSMFLDILGSVNTAVRSSIDLNHVLDSIVRVVCESLRAKGCTIRLLDRRGDLDMRASFGLSLQYLETASDARNDPRIRHREEVAREKISSALFVPLRSRDKAIGVLSLYTHNPYRFSEDEVQLMITIGEQCALAIQNAQMYHAVKRKYEDVVDEFHQWFEHYQTYPVRNENRA
jgi:signal transduction protein with GAF and PtsI domain